jgi:hypothetical protein
MKAFEATKPNNIVSIKFKPLTIALCLAGLWQLPMLANSQAPQQPLTRALQLPATQTVSTQAPRIQISILLDTSGSMDGLIDQTRGQIWQMIDEFAKAKKAGVNSQLEVAVYEYGNDGLASQQGYIRKVTGLTTDLDRVSEALFSLTTNGGSEYCGYVIDTAVRQLQWSTSDQDIKAIFIAGNEAFTQGPVPYSEAITAAKAKGIKVHTIFAGNYQQGTSSGWQQGALLAGGDYMSIDHNQHIAHITAPQDQKIAELNTRLNQTYIPYGTEGEQAAKRQREQDANSSGVSSGMLAERVKSKVSAAYKTASWDLVDAVKDGLVKLDEMEPEALPTPMATMSTEQQETFIKQKATERDELKKEIARLNKQREDFVATEKNKAAKPAHHTMSDALSSAIRKQGEAKNFEFN